VLAILPKKANELLKIVSMGSTTILLLGVCYIYSKFQSVTPDMQFGFRYTSLRIQSLNIEWSFAIDGISILFVMLTAFIIPLTILYVWDDKDFKYYALVLVLSELLLLLAFTTWNLFLFYVFFELLIIPMFIMINVWGSRDRKVWASYLLAMFTIAGSILFLMALAYIFQRVGTWDVITIAHFRFTSEEQLFLWIAFCVAFACKIPMIPFHIWLPEAHGEAPTVGSVLLAGVLLKLGVYGFIRYPIGMLPLVTVKYGWIIILIAAIGCVYSACCALRCTDAKKIIAYSSVSHMNLIVVGLFSNSIEGIEAAIMQSVSHGIVSSALFFLIGIIYDRYHTRDVYRFYYIFQAMPVYSIFFIFFVLSNMAIPGTANFVGEFLLMSGAFKNNVLCATFCALSVIIGAVYSLWVCVRLLYKKDKPADLTKEELGRLRDLTYPEFFILAMLAFASLYFGLHPNTYITLIHSSVHNIYEYTVGMHGM
jgi:proton-translocating NADH-quinone oxidoreductase chain M